MTTYAFSAVVTGLNLIDLEQLDFIYTDAFVISPAEIDGVTSVAVEIEAPTGEHALQILTDHLSQTGVTVDRIDPDLVNIPEIADRLEVSREMVRLWTVHQRGDGDFPRHRTLVGNQKLWTWADVFAWAAVHGRLQDALSPLDTACVDWFNGQAGAVVQPSQVYILAFTRTWADSWVSGWDRAVNIDLREREVVFEARGGEAWTYSAGALMAAPVGGRRG